jgi:hypothetical protein
MVIFYCKACTQQFVLSRVLARVQGTFYSLRILQQITDLLVSHSRSSSLPEEIFILHNRLKTLSVLAEIPDLRSVASVVRKIESNGMVKAAYEILGIEEQKSPKIEQSFQRAKKQKTREARTQILISKGKLTNPFALLDTE